MNASTIMDLTGMLIYAAEAAVAVWGVFCVILMLRRIEKKKFRNAENEALFFSKLREQLSVSDYEAALKVCNSPTYWDRAVARLVALAIENRKEGLSKIRRMIVERFERDVLTELEYRLSWIQTVIKSAPMLGLLGTVVGMISAFGKMAGVQRPDATQLAGDISFALLTTAYGLIIAIPLILCAAYINVRMRHLEDAVEDGMARFLEDFQNAAARSSDPRRAAQYAQPRG